MMFEMSSCDDVDAAFDRVWDSPLDIPNGLGRHDNDGMFSFYLASPAGFQVLGWSRSEHDHRRLGQRPPLRPHQRLGSPAAATVMTTPIDVIVVGHGPTGAALAILLAQRGHSVTILERQPVPYALPRAVHFDHEVGRILQSCGIGAELRKNIEPADIYEWRNAAGTVLLRIGRRGLAASGWPVSSMFNQPKLEQLLDERARSLDKIDVRRGVEVVGVRQDDDVAAVTTSDREELAAQYVVGCDGANSTVRDLIGVPVQDLGFFFDWLIVDVVLHEDREFDPLNVQICDPARPTTAVSGGPGRRRWEFMRLPHEDITELNSEQAAWRLLEPWDVSAENATLERHAVYTFQARHAEQWRAGRVLLAGDAAHQMPPFAGQGMCSGLRDAANLAWKLDLVLGGHAPSALLETYEDERLPSARAAIDFSMELGKIICVPDPDEAAARDAAMSAGVGDEPTDVDLPSLDSGIVHSSAPYAGALFVQGQVGDAYFDDVHGAGWRLVALNGTAKAPAGAATDWFDSVGGRIVVVDPDEPTFERWFAEHDAATWALQRPDFRLYGTASDTTDAERLLQELRADLTKETHTS